MRGSVRIGLILSGVVGVCGAVGWGQVPLRRVLGLIDEGQVLTLEGNVHPMARGEFDEGLLGADVPLGRMVLELKATAAQQAELDALVEAQQDARSPLYHQWLTPAEYGGRFGVSVSDLGRVTAWLAGHGFVVEEVPAGRRLVVFSGTAGQVAEAFHTEMHRYRVAGVEHIANSLDPQVPVALEGVVGGVVSLHDFRRRAAVTMRRPVGWRGMGLKPLYSNSGTNLLFPADWAAIYDVDPVYQAGTTGAGTSIAIVGRSDIKLADVAEFRQVSGLAANVPAVILAGADPGVVSGDQDESTLDVEWSGAIAPGAAVKFVVGASSGATDGVDLAAAYVVNHATAPVVSASYGSCEQEMGTAELAFYNSLWEQAASEGISAFVSSGDSGAAGCYAGSAVTATGTGVNGLCSSPYATCVGGTEFNEGANAAKYWGTTNPGTYGSALGYIPEVVWNESGANGGVGLWASTGGASTVYAQPSWQKGVSGSSLANGMRAVPDVSMDAASHDPYTIVENGNFYVIAGTSASSPSLAGLMALVVEAQGGKGLGSANPELYALLNGAHNPFHATPAGNNSVPGVTGFAASGGPYNLATGLGSVDGAVLVGGWGSGAGETTQPATLALTAGASAVSLTQGAAGTVSFSVATGGTFAGNVSLSIAGLPAGVTARWSANPVAGGGQETVTLTLSAAASATAGTAKVGVTAAGDGLTASQTVTVEVEARQSCFGLARAGRLGCAAPIRH